MIFGKGNKKSLQAKYHHKNIEERALKDQHYTSIAYSHPQKKRPRDNSEPLYGCF